MPPAACPRRCFLRRSLCRTPSSWEAISSTSCRPPRGVVLPDGSPIGAAVLYEPDGSGGRRMLFGTPIEEREQGVEYPLSGFRSSHGSASGKGVLLVPT